MVATHTSPPKFSQGGWKGVLPKSGNKQGYIVQGDHSTLDSGPVYHQGERAKRASCRYKGGSGGDGSDGGGTSATPPRGIK